MLDASRTRAEVARTSKNLTPRTNKEELLTTKEVAALTGFSASYFEKGRIYNYGPTSFKVRGSGKGGKVLYRRSAVEAWLTAEEEAARSQNNG